MSAPKDPATQKVSKHAEAFKESGNLITLAGSLAVSAALLNPLPFLACLVGEAAYMLFVPDSKWFEKRLSAKYDREIEERRKALREQILPTLSLAMQRRYNGLEATRDQIYAQAKESNAPWFREILRKLDFLLEKFLMFGNKEVQFQNYLESVLNQVRTQSEEFELPKSVPPPKLKVKVRSQRESPLDPRVPDEIELNPDSNWVKRTVQEIQEAYNEELERIHKFLQQGSETELHTQAVLEKRIEVIQRRHEHIGRLGSILINLNHQARLMEDTFGLINDEIRARSPEQVLADIDEVVMQTNAMTETLEEVAPFEQMVAKLTA